MFEAFDFSQDKHFALLRGKPRERALDGHAQRMVRRRRGSFRKLRSLEIFRRRLLAADLLAAHVVAGIHEDAVHPGGKRRLAFEVCDAAVHFQKRLLYGVFGVVAIAEKIHRQAPQAHAVRLIELLEAAEPAAAARRGQGRVRRARLREAERVSRTCGRVGRVVGAGQMYLRALLLGGPDGIGAGPLPRHCNLPR